MFYYPSDAPCTILFCKLCAVVTSWLTTNACTGACCPNAEAIWFVVLVPNISNDGVCGAVGVGILGVATEVLAPPPLNPAGGSGGLVDAICLTFLIPVAIIDAAPTNPNNPPCERALFAPANVSCIACTIAIDLPNLEFWPTMFAISPNVCLIWACFASAN